MNLYTDIGNCNVMNLAKGTIGDQCDYALLEKKFNNDTYKNEKKELSILVSVT